METKRVYVGGLYHEATENDISQLFSKFGYVESVEIKKRTENDAVNFVFAYVNVKTTGDEITKCFRRLNGTFWKGRRLKLELARESFLSRLQREREQNKARWFTPSQTPQHHIREHKILDNVLSKQRKSNQNGGLVSRPNKVIDFSQQDSGVDTGTPRKKDEKHASEVKNDGLEPNLADSCSASYTTSTPKSPMKRPRSPFETSHESDDETPVRGALRMFGGIGGGLSSGAKLDKDVPSVESGVDESIRKKKVLSEDTSSKKKKRQKHEKFGDTSDDEETPVSEMTQGEVSTPHETGDFLSRLEAFSTVWGDDDVGSQTTAATSRCPLHKSDSHSESSQYAASPGKRKSKNKLLEDVEEPAESGRKSIGERLNGIASDDTRRSRKSHHTSPTKSHIPNQLSSPPHQTQTDISSTKHASEESSQNQTTSGGHSAMLHTSRSAASVRDDNQRRMDSLKQKQEAFKSQKRALQMALSSKADAARPNKKIVFDDLDSDAGAASTTPTDVVTPTDDVTAPVKKHGPSLFEDDGEELDSDDDFRIRPQYEGKKGQKLQALQSTYGADKRFSLDDRFAEPEKLDEDDATEPAEEEDVVRVEHAAQLDILQSVLGRSVKSPEKPKQKKMQSSMAGPVRYDPSLEAHSQYLLERNKHQQNKDELEDGVNPPEDTAPATSVPKVSEERFHTVDPSLGDMFSSKSRDSAGFSLLEMMGRAHDTDVTDPADDNYTTTKMKSKKKTHPLDVSSNPFQYDSSSSDDEAADGSTSASLGVAPGGWNQTRKFFLQKGDPRLQEGVEFVQSARSTEDLQKLAAEHRADLLELFRTQKHSRQRELKKARERNRRHTAR